MSVGIIIEYTKQQDEDAPLYLPIATEKFYHKYWLKAAIELKLTIWEKSAFGTNVDINSLPQILEELSKLKKWAEIRLDGKNRKYMEKRINLLLEYLPDIFWKDQHCVLLIG